MSAEASEGEALKHRALRGMLSGSPGAAVSSHAVPTAKHVFLSLQGRSHLNHEKEMFAQDHPEVNSLEEVVRLVKPTAIIGRRRQEAHCPAQLTLLPCRWKLRLSQQA